MNLIQDIVSRWYLIGPFAICPLPIYLLLKRLFGRKDEQKKAESATERQE